MKIIRKHEFIKLSFILIIIFVFCSCNKTKVTKTANGVIAEVQKIDGNQGPFKINIEVLSPTIIKVAAAKTDSALNAPSLIARETIEENINFEVNEQGNFVEVITDSLTAKLNLDNGQISYIDLQQNILLTEAGKQINAFQNDNAGHQNSIKQWFQWTGDEVLYGLGQHELEDLNIRGHKIELTQQNTRVSVPVILSTKGYGLYWDNYSRSVYDDTGDKPFIASEIGDKIQYYFIKGASFDNIIADFRSLTGEVPMLPRWALGYIQSRNRYKNREQLMGVVKKHRQLAIPVDAIILDYLHWGDKGFGSMVFDPEDFPDPEEMISQLHNDYNCKLIVSVWPSLEKNIPNWRLFEEKGLLLDLDLGQFGQVHDAFNPEAGQLYFDLVKKSYLDKGVDAIWFDATEPEKFDQFAETQSFLGPTARYLNLYSYFDMKNIYENQRRDREKRAFVLTRSAFAGQQKFGSVIWSGDIGTDFKTLKEQIPTGLNFCMTGIPYWNTDIGGYLGGDPNDPDYQEVFTRWFQYGTFTPFFRAHGRRHPAETRSGENELWSFGKEKQEILTSFVKLRYRLLPYIYTLSHKVHHEGYTLMRALAFDFMADNNVLEINDQFMFGDNILVCPVVEKGAEKRRVYLPEGTNWFDFWTGQKHNGGQTIEASAPIETIPLFVKEGTILPMGEIMQYATEKPPEEIELRIYSGQDATFTLYEDENNNYNYTKGKFTQIPIAYNPETKTLNIGPTQGEFEGMLKERTFNIVLVDEKSGVGIGKDTKPVTSLTYKGEAVSLKIE